MPPARTPLPPLPALFLSPRVLRGRGVRRPPCDRRAACSVPRAAARSRSFGVLARCRVLVPPKADSEAVETMPQHAAPQRPRSETQACPGVPAVLSFREEAAALRAARDAAPQSQSTALPSPEEVDAFFARRRVRLWAAALLLRARLTRRRVWALPQATALKAAEERWGISFTAGEEPVPVAGHDWEWRIEAHAAGACSDVRRRGAARRGAPCRGLGGRSSRQKATD